MAKRRLGKGIDALLQGRPLEQLTQMSSILMVDIASVSPNPDQPRKRFNDDTLAELADSIREKGIIQPILAEDRGDGTYVIIAGERRYRAAKIAGLDEVPIISQDFSEEEKLEIALIENLQREDLNPVDEARALQSAIDHAGITQDQLAKRLGKSRSAVANALRLLRLDDTIQASLAEGSISAGHARALLALDDESQRTLLAKRIVSDGLSVRDAETAVKGGALDLGALSRETTPAASADVTTPSIPQRPAVASSGTIPSVSIGDDDESLEIPYQPGKSVELKRIEDVLVHHLGTRVVISGDDHSGKIVISYVSSDDLERLVESMGAKLDE